MKGNDKAAIFTLRHGPWVWALSGVMGLLGGAGLTHALKPQFSIAGSPQVTLVMVIPFVALLASIALMPLVAQRIWHRHYPDIALGLGGLVVGYYLAGFRSLGGP